MKKYLISLFACMFLLISCQNKEHLVLKKELFVFELGEEIPADSKEYLVEDSDPIILEKTVFELKDPLDIEIDEMTHTVHSINKEYLDTGDYVFYLTYESEIKEVHVRVEDTTAPTFVHFQNEIRIEQNALNVDVTKYFACEDMSACRIKVDSFDVDLSQTGDYQISVQAIDDHDNIVEEKAKVSVVTMEEARKDNGVTLTLDGTLYQSQALINKLEEENKKVPSIPSDSNPSSDTTPSKASGKYHSNYAKEVLTLVNQQRKKAGLGPLSWDSNLASAADIRAKEIEISFSHTRPDGNECFSAVNGSYWTLGENIAYGYTTAEAVMEGWMNSQGHKDNILNENFTKLGVSCYIDASGTYQWVQMFGG